MTSPEENERRRQVSERYLAEVEARPRAVKPFVNAVCAELGINGNEWHHWMLNEAPDHYARWQRAKLMWAEARDQFLVSHPKMGEKAAADILGVRPYTVRLARARLKDRRVKLPGSRRGAGLRALTEEETEALRAFEARIEAYESGADTSNPADAIARLSKRWKRLQIARYVDNAGGTRPRQDTRTKLEDVARKAYRKPTIAHLLISYRPDLRARYLDAVDVFWQRVVLLARKTRAIDAARAYDLAGSTPVSRRLRLLEAGKEVNRMVMRDGAIEVLPPRYKKPKETVHDHQHADWEGY